MYPFSYVDHMKKTRKWSLKIDIPYLVGGFNPFEKYSSKWIISPGRVENQKYLKPPPRPYPYAPKSTSTNILKTSFLINSPCQGAIQPAGHRATNRWKIETSQLEKAHWVDQLPILGMFTHPTSNDENPYNGYINPYYWVGGWTNAFEKYAHVKLDHFPRRKGWK